MKGWKTCAVALGVLLITTFCFGETITVITTTSALPKWELTARLVKEKLGIDLDIVSQGYNETRQKIVTAMAAKSSVYDIVLVDTIWLPEFVEAGWLVPLEISPEYWEDGTEAWQQVTQYKGHVWLIGAGFNAKFMLINKQLLEAAGFSQPPATWEEFIEQALRMKQMGVVEYPVAWGWAEAEGLVCDFTVLLAAFGGSYQDESGNWRIYSEPAVKALRFMTDTLTVHKIAHPSSVILDDRAVMELFLNGDVAYVLTWTWGWTWAKDPARSKVVDYVEPALIPGTLYANTRSATTNGGSGYGISAFSRKKQLAREVLEIYGSPETEYLFAAELNMMEFTRKSIATSPEYLEKFPFAAFFLEQLKYNYPRPRHPLYSEISNILRRQIHRALLGETTPEEALLEAQRLISELK